MPFKTTTALALMLALTTGCSHSMNEIDAGSVKAHLNPHPKERYELTFTIHDAPGPFESVTAGAQYGVGDEIGHQACIPVDAFSGAQSKTPGIIRPVPLERMAPETYRGEVTVDLIADEDYFGLGVCHWNDMGAGINLVAHGVTFNAVIGQKDIEAGTAVSTYFAKASLNEPSGYSDGGVDGRYVAPSVKYQPEKFFYVTISAKRIEP